MANSVLSTTTVSAGAVTTVLILNNTQYIISSFGDLWRMDGVNLTRVAPAVGSNSLGWEVFNNTIYYADVDGSTVIGLYEWDGSSNWTLVGSTATETGYNIFLTVFNSNLYITCGRTLYIWDGVSSLVYLADTSTNECPTGYFGTMIRPIPYGGVFYFIGIFDNGYTRTGGMLSYSGGSFTVLTNHLWTADITGQFRYYAALWMSSGVLVVPGVHYGSAWQYFWLYEHGSSTLTKTSDYRTQPFDYNFTPLFGIIGANVIGAAAEVNGAYRYVVSNGIYSGQVYDYYPGENFPGTLVYTYVGSTGSTFLGGAIVSGDFYVPSVSGTMMTLYSFFDPPTATFSVLNFNSPSPAYLRLDDTSDLSSVTSETGYTRIWSLVNNRTSASTVYTTSASSIEIVLEGLYGDTFNVSLSAVY